MFFNNWIGFFNETYLFLGICVAINTFYFRFDSFGNVTNSLFTLLFGITILMLPFFTFIFYNSGSVYTMIRNRDEEFLSRYGQLIQGLNFKRLGRLALVYPCSNQIRKLWFICTLVYM